MKEMRERTYQEVCDEIRRLWDCDHMRIHTGDDGFSETIDSLMYQVASENPMIEKNTFYGKVYRQFKKRRKNR